MRILAEHPTHRAPATCAGRIILVERDDSYHPFVTWWENTDLGGRHWGHYFETKAEAEEDYAERVRRGY
jgi:hypothetical protein